jgi:very-short-patch-repair endonuclease
LKSQRRKETVPSVLWNSLEEQALRMRRVPTLAEDLLWQRLRGGKVDGLKFRRQHAVGKFIVDFYCVTAALVIEVDGPIHEYQRDRDAERQTYLEAMGLTVLRFTNAEVVSDIDQVVARIRDAATPSD